MGRSALVICGSVLVLIGLVGFAIAIFAIQRARDVTTIGDLNLSTIESTSHVIPRLVGGGVLVISVMLIGAGLYRNRRTTFHTRSRPMRGWPKVERK